MHTGPCPPGIAGGHVVWRSVKAPVVLRFCIGLGRLQRRRSPRDHRCTRCIQGRARRAGLGDMGAGALSKCLRCFVSGFRCCFGRVRSRRILEGHRTAERMQGHAHSQNLADIQIDDRQVPMLRFFRGCLRLLGMPVHLWFMFSILRPTHVRVGVSG